MKKFVRITSTKYITVDPGMLYIDMTNKNANIPDRLRVADTWVELRTKIKAGTYWYPSIITEWGSVKTLSKEGVLTIGEQSDSCDDAEVVAHYNKLQSAIAHNKSTAKETSAIKKAQNKAKSKELEEDNEQVTIDDQ